MNAPSPSREKLALLMLGALGVVFGDIGTSPLYALRECFIIKDGALAPHAVAVTPANVLGVLSLVFWSLTGVVAVKYLGWIVKADNKGEGGIFALLGLIPQSPEGQKGKGRNAVVLAALFGAALLYGDGVITPAISVLSAVEGLEVANPAARPLILPIALGVLFALFAVQRRRATGIAAIFGPVTLGWFLAIAALGMRFIVRTPEVLAAVNPKYAIDFFLANGGRGFAVLGSVVLCITGAEALYADLGSFGRKPIRSNWFAIVFPALLLNYFGQGAYLLERGHHDRPFWALVPEVLLYPMVILATAAAVIASQAVITGAFSLTRQAVQLGYLPRVTIVHTSPRHEGQIYIPEVNKALAISCLGVVFAFGESDALAGAYGIAVTGTMAITSIVYYFVVTRRWGWSAWKTLPLVALFLLSDAAFFGANLLKFSDGGWFPLLLGLVLFTVMTTWKTGRRALAERFTKLMNPLEDLLDDFNAYPPHRVRGTAVFMTGSPTGTPPVLLHHLKHNQMLHEQVVLLSILPQEVPTVAPEDRMVLQRLSQGFFRLIVRVGFMETPDVPSLLRAAGDLGLETDPATLSYYLGHERLLTGGTARLSHWRKALFAFVSRNALPATSYFGIPPGRVVELGMQLDL